MKQRWDLELRILIDEAMDGLTRATMLEIDLGIVSTEPPLKLCSLLHDTAEAWLRKYGTVQFRTGDQIPAGLLHAWICAESDESVAEDAGLVYHGALARVVHVMCENEIQTVNQP